MLTLFYVAEITCIKSLEMMVSEACVVGQSFVDRVSLVRGSWSEEWAYILVEHHLLWLVLSTSVAGRTSPTSVMSGPL